MYKAQDMVLVYLSCYVCDKKGVSWSTTITNTRHHYVTDRYDQVWSTYIPYYPNV